MPAKRKALVFDRDPFEETRGDDDQTRLANMTKIADADLVMVVKGDEAKIVKLRWEEPEEYDVEVVRP
jgi:hypothetical protein